MQLPLPAICLMGQHLWLDAARCPQANKGGGWVALKAATSKFFQDSSMVPCAWPSGKKLELSKMEK